MSEQSAFKEAVFLFEGDRVSTEMLYSEFEALLNRAAPVPAAPGSEVRGVYVVIGSALAVRGAVCFKLRVGDEGYADPEFSVPLRHLVRAAGPGPDLGCGAIRLASRSQCPVSWHATNLWEPDVTDEGGPLTHVQRLVWRNRLRIRIAADVPDLSRPVTSVSAATNEPPAEPRAEPAMARRAAAGPPADANMRQLRAHYQRQAESLMRRHRLELEQQQQIYLDQIRTTRDEVQRLRTLLSHERTRSQRLQRLLRGEV